MTFDCINLHFTDSCNFHCKHCFVKKENNELTMDELIMVVNKIEAYFLSHQIEGRINIAGGEPLLSRNIDKLIDLIHSRHIKVSIITNGYYLDQDFIERHKTQIDSIGISVDSLDYDTNIKIGRCSKNNVLSKEKLIYLAKIIHENQINLKINICLSKLNIHEDFHDFIHELKPERLKVFQMLCGKNSIVFPLIATEDEISPFLRRLDYPYVYESSESMRNSYLIIDSKGTVSTNNLHLSSISIFDYEIEEILNKVNVDYDNYLKRYL